MPEVVIFLINLCIAFLCLNISYIISSFVDGSETTCKAFSFIFHYFLLVSCAALASMAFFTGVIPPFDGKKKLMYLGPIAAGWSTFPFMTTCAEFINFPFPFSISHHHSGHMLWFGFRELLESRALPIVSMH